MKNAKLEKASKYKKWYIITSISPFILEIIFVLMGAICSTRLKFLLGSFDL